MKKRSCSGSLPILSLQGCSESVSFPGLHTRTQSTQEPCVILILLFQYEERLVTSLHPAQSTHPNSLPGQPAGAQVFAGTQQESQLSECSGFPEGSSHGGPQSSPRAKLCDQTAVIKRSDTPDCLQSYTRSPTFLFLKNPLHGPSSG